MRPGSGSQGTAAGCITPLLLLKFTDSPCVCTVVCNACAFYFNLPCHFSLRQTFRRKRFLFSIHPLCTGSFFYLSCPCPFLPPSNILVHRRRYRDVTLFLIPPLKHCIICAATEWSRPIEHALLLRAWMYMSGVNCAWLLSPHDPAPHHIPTTTKTPSPYPPSPLIAGGATGSRAERGLWFLSQWAQCIFKLGPFVCVTARPKTDLHAGNTNQTFDRSS